MWRRTLVADQLARVLAPFIVTIAHESPSIKIFSIASRSRGNGCEAMILQPRPTGGDGSFLLSQTQVCHPIPRGPRTAFTHCAGSGSSSSATLALAFFLYASLISLLGGAPQGTLLPAGWPNHRIPLQSPFCQANTINSAYARCKSLVRGECVGDDMTSASDRAGVKPGCILDFEWHDARGATTAHRHRHGASEQGVRLTFLWYATEAMSEQASVTLISTDFH